MRQGRLLDECEALARKLGIEVRYEHLKSSKPYPGGYCLLRQDPKIIMERNLPKAEKIARFAEIFTTLELDEVYLLPALRELIERHRREFPISGNATNGKNGA
jgi:hypothetical protein